jgi:hypothetical protein
MPMRDPSDTEKLISLKTVFTPNDFEILSQDNGIIRLSFHASRLFYQKQPGLKRSAGILLNYADRQIPSSGSWIPLRFFILVSVKLP